MKTSFRVRENIYKPYVVYSVISPTMTLHANPRNLWMLPSKAKETLQMWRGDYLTLWKGNIVIEDSYKKTTAGPGDDCSRDCSNEATIQ